MERTEYQELKPTLLLYGASGWIGGQLVPLLAPRYAVIAATARLEDTAAVETEVRRLLPDKVVLAAGITGRPNVDWCESHREQTLAVNYTGTVHLVRLCAELGIHITNFATGCIYEYDSDHPIGGPGFTEDEPPNFSASYYSHTKQLAEAATRDCGTQLLLRLRMPITADSSPRCFLTKIANYARVVDIPNSVSVLPTLLPLAVDMLTHGKTGVYNFVNPGPVSHAQVLTAYRDFVDTSFAYTVMSKAEHDGVVRAPRSNNTLSAAKLVAAAAEAETEAGGRHIPDAYPAIVELLGNLHARLRPYAPAGILVTGGCGFIGAALVAHLRGAYAGIPIVAYDSMQPCAARLPLPGGVAVVKASIQDCDALRAAIVAYGIDTVFHLAAETHVDASFDNTFQFTETNVLGTHKVLHTCARWGEGQPTPIRRFVHMSTDEVYGGTAEAAACEASLLCPTNPYAASKVGAEALVHAYMKSYGLRAVVVRANNVYGPRQYPEKVVPRFLVRHMRGLPAQVQGTGTQTRNFIFVDDVAAALACIMTKALDGDTVNIGSSQEYSVNQLAAQIWGAGSAAAGSATEGSAAAGSAAEGSMTEGSAAASAAAIHVEDRHINDQRYHVDDTRLRALGWRPLIPFDAGLELTRQWYAAHASDLEAIWPDVRAALHALDAPQVGLASSSPCVTPAV
jgi:3,5-epimerase/4-reductase